MLNLLLLVKTDLRETLDFRKFREDKKKTASFLVIIGIAILGGLALSTLYNLLFGYMFYEAGTNLVYSTLFMSGLASVLTFSTSVFKTKSIFVGKDYEMLCSMPIKKSTIIASKIINLYLLELLYAAIVMLPNLVINTIFSGDLSFILTGILATILISSVPMALSVLFALFLALVADRYRFGNIINVFLYGIMFVGVFYFSFSMNGVKSTPTDGVPQIQTMIDTANVMGYMNPTMFLIRNAYLENYLYILGFVASNIAILVLVIFLVAILRGPIYEAINSYKSNRVYLRKDLKVEGQGTTLLKNEFKRYFNSKFYFINTICSGIVAIVMTTLLCVTISPVLNGGVATINGQDITNVVHQYGFVGYLLIVFAIGIATPTSCCISIEGKSFWQIKSLPINVKSYLKTKLLLSIIVLGVCSLIASIIAVVLLQPTIFCSIMLIVLPLLYVVASSLVGLLINLSYYKLKWKTEQECCKQSAGVVISMLVDWVVMLVLCGLSIGLCFVNEYLAGISTAISLIIFDLVCYKVLLSIGEKKINQIDEA